MGLSQTRWPIVADAAIIYLGEASLFQDSRRCGDGMERGGGRVDEAEEPVRGLGALLGHHGHVAEGRGGSAGEECTWVASRWMD